MDIVSGMVWELNNETNYVDLVEDGTVDFDCEKIVIGVNVKNTGEESADATVTLKDNGGNVLEQKTVTIAGGDTQAVAFDNSGAGYDLPDGATNSYTVEATP